MAGRAVTTSNETAVVLSSVNGSVSLTAVNALSGLNAINIFGNTGSFCVVGEGSGARNGTGGTIQNTQGNAVVLQHAQNIRLRSMTVQDTTAVAVYGLNLNAKAGQPETTAHALRSARQPCAAAVPADAV